MKTTGRNITDGNEGNYPILNKVTDQNNNVLRALFLWKCDRKNE